MAAKGSYYNIGLSLGKQLENKLYYSSMVSQNHQKLANESVIHIQNFFPEILEEIQGIIDVSGINKENFIPRVNAQPLKYVVSTCFTVSYGK
ncbi:MAG: hypothetical protein ACFFDW_02890 [Candidatus Thorarchaeota archaeon]